MSLSIPENLENVRHLVSQFEQKYERIDSPVQLIAVSKTHSADKVTEAFNAGQRQFGENYLQEALEKIDALGDLPVCWHFIGPIQSNKTRAIAENFDWVHTVERLKIARRLSEQRPDALSPLNILLQVNISEEASKAGVSLAELPALAEQISTLPQLQLAGLMAIPAPVKALEQQRQQFRLLRDARDRLVSQGHSQCRHLSMGMSRDFEAAIAEGATMIRIGTDIFGARG